ncbi:PucR family transcriptional regulator [Halalkalibacter urbisdiaboli]|uniref:PucR family transcriptional regulator n=1 Tax=Halalkalibacter urbisdiaboli TaxID=1960589 RepID=UPI0013FDDA54|nr:helix-turn-helix domain-containing protein [Halalkalibacter urbisdiaboli]
MYQTLKHHFADAIVNNLPAHPHPDILWLQDEHKEPIGFWKSKLTEKEQALLTMLLEKHQHTPQPSSNVEKRWMSWLFQESPNVPQGKTVRFIHFHLDRSIDDYESFQEVWASIATNETAILWIDQHNGLIVTEETEEETPDYIGFVEAIASDFYIDLSLLIGSNVEVELSKSQFHWERSCFQAAIAANPSKQVFHEHEAIPYFLLDHLPFEQKQYVINQIITAEIAEDHELLKTVSVYFQQNLNISAAAKALFMHRNSLQYRIDKFVERTGVDIKQFPQAAIMYFLLLLIERK